MSHRKYLKGPDGKLAGSVSLGGKTPPPTDSSLPQESTVPEPFPVPSDNYQETYGMLESLLDEKEVKNMEQVKYPRTSHLPTSPGLTSDDRVISAEGYARLQQLPDYVVTEKMDGGNVTMTRNHFYGRSLDSGTHAWDTHAKRIWANISYRIPEGYRISGESLYAERSIRYENLPDYYLVFGVWNNEGALLSWDDTKQFASELELSLVPELYRGGSFTSALHAWQGNHDTATSEGFVIRSSGPILLDDFPDLVAKHVRAEHVTTRADWRHRDDFRTNSVTPR